MWRLGCRTRCRTALQCAHAFHSCDGAGAWLHTLLAALAWMNVSAAWVLQSTHDRLCLADAPLRFDHCDSSSTILFEFHADGRLKPSVSLSQPLPRWRLYQSGIDDKYAACADRWCLRCLSRGNHNRARVVFCAVDGYEELSVTVASSPRLITEPESLFFTVTLIAATVAVMRQRSKLTRRFALALSDVRDLRLRLRSARDDLQPAQLWRVLQQGGLFYELGRGGIAKPVHMQLAPLCDHIQVFDAFVVGSAAVMARKTRRKGSAGTVGSGSSSSAASTHTLPADGMYSAARKYSSAAPIYTISFDAVRRLTFAQPSRPSEATAPRGVPLSPLKDSASAPE